MSNSKESQSPIQQVYKKMVRGLIIRIIFCIVIPIIIGITVPYLMSYANQEVPRWFKPVLIIASIIIFIATIVKYVVTQYFFLKNGFMNLEQNLQQSMSTPPVDYTVQTPLNYQQYPNQQYYNQYNAMGQNLMNAGYYQNNIPYQNVSEEAYPHQKKVDSCFTKFTAFAFEVIGVLMILLSLLFFGGNAVTQIYAQKNYTETNAYVTKTEEFTKVVTDEDGSEERTEYHVDYEYYFEGQIYKSTFDSPNFLSVGSSITVYVNPENPEVHVRAASNIAIVIFSIFALLPLMIAIIRLSARRKRKLRGLN